mgnify:CR=1 FL=1
MVHHKQISTEDNTLVQLKGIWVLIIQTKKKEKKEQNYFMRYFQNKNGLALVANGQLIDLKTQNFQKKNI